MLLCQKCPWEETPKILQTFSSTCCNPECWDTVQEWSCVKILSACVDHQCDSQTSQLCRTVGSFPPLKHFGTMKSNIQLSEQIEFRASKAYVQSVHSLLQRGPNNFISGIMLLEVVGPERMKLISGLKFYAIDSFYSEHCTIYIIFWVLRKIIGILLCPSLSLFHHTPLLVPFYFSLFMWLHYDISLI